MSLIPSGPENFTTLQNFTDVFQNGASIGRIFDFLIELR